METFVQGRFGLSLMGALWLALSVQADRAARRFLKEGLVWPASPTEKSPPEKEAEVIYLSRLGGRKWEHGAEPKTEPKPAPAKARTAAQRGAPPLAESPQFFREPSRSFGNPGNSSHRHHRPRLSPLDQTIPSRSR
jgi:hypothetical protein